MSDSGDRNKRPGGKPDGARSDQNGPRRGQPASGGPRRDGGPSRGFDSPRTGAGDRGRVDRSAGNPFQTQRGGRDTEWEDRDPYGIKAVRNRHDDPEIPDDVKAGDLDKGARTQLKTLSKENAEEVARHLAMAARLIEENPALAHRHAVSAARRAGRIAVVRETLAITAYLTGDFGLALRELRTYRRISGKNDQLPMMVDSERGLGRPDKALELGRSVDRSSLPVDVQVELAIAMSGARLDLGQLDAALSELEIPQLDANVAFSWSPALFDAYAAVLEDLGRADEAEEWYKRSDRAQGALNSSELGDDDETMEVVEEELEFDFEDSDEDKHEGDVQVEDERVDRDSDEVDDAARVHADEPAEGDGSDEAPAVERVHSDAPAEGADFESAADIAESAADTAEPSLVRSDEAPA